MNTLLEMTPAESPPELETDNQEQTAEQEPAENSRPIVVKLMTGEELIVNTLTTNANLIILENPYVVMRQIVSNMPSLFLLRWIPYSASRTFVVNSTAILTVTLANDEMTLHYKTCLREEIMDDISSDQITTNNYTLTIN